MPAIHVKEEGVTQKTKRLQLDDVDNEIVAASVAKSAKKHWQKQHSSTIIIIKIQLAKKGKNLTASHLHAGAFEAHIIACYKLSKLHSLQHETPLLPPFATARARAHLTHIHFIGQNLGNISFYFNFN